MAYTKFWSDDFEKKGEGGGSSCPPIFSFTKKATDI